MEILRVPPYDMAVTVEVALASTSYEVTITDLADSSVSTQTLTSDANGIISVTLPSDYDESYKITIDGEDSFVDVVRPYVDPNTKGTTATEISEYKANEELARAIIDSIIPEGFYYGKHVIETTGLGSDYLPLWVDAKHVLKVYENNVLVYDADNADLYQRSFEVTKDKTAIVQSSNEAINRMEGAATLIPMAASDTDVISYFTRNFAKGADYVIIVEAGYYKVPSDIVRATELLVDDISCGKLDYYKRYISDYNTDQFRIKFDGKVFEGTGNLLVDKILSKYAKGIQTLGVL